MCVDICFVIKQKTAYEMRISDWSSDVCSSDLENVLLWLLMRREKGAIEGLGWLDQSIGCSSTPLGRAVDPSSAFCAGGRVLCLPGASFVFSGASLRSMTDPGRCRGALLLQASVIDRKSTRLNSSH